MTQLPQNRELKKLWDICDLQNGFAFKSKDYIDKSNTLNFRMSNIRPWWILDLEHNKKCLPEEYSDKYKDFLLNDWDVVIAMTDMATEMKILWIPTIIETKWYDLLLNQRVWRFMDIDKNKLYIPYLRIILLSSETSKYYKSLWAWWLQINLSKKSILNLTFPLPPLETQQAIVAKLDEIFANLDQTKSEIQKNIQATDEVWKSSLNKVFEEWDWEMTELNNVFDVRDWTHNSPKYHSEGYPLVTSKNLKENWLDISNVKFISKEDYDNINKRSWVSIWDILFAMIGTIWNPIIIQEEPNFSIKNVALFKYKEWKCLAEFLRYFLWSDFVLNKMLHEAKWATQKFVWLWYLRKFQIPLPPLPKQKAIVAHLDQLSTHTKQLKQKYQSQLDHIEELRKSVLDQAFKGELI